MPVTLAVLGLLITLAAVMCAVRTPAGSPPRCEQTTTERVSPTVTVTTCTRWVSSR